MKREETELSYQGETERERQRHDDWEINHMHAATGSSKSPPRLFSRAGLFSLLTLHKKNNKRPNHLPFGVRWAAWDAKVTWVGGAKHN
ncbi:hypothetical protein EYF80_008654 [Liparis tanakae]|uniref:Uncharacterized protein n=1 Tax=Liparis tanakae TaxID=230148 RepID=A0A4Z2ITS9_9TELE|nr:hypothetical protein EYF80_008654 [Liparis tanakae]